MFGTISPLVRWAAGVLLVIVTILGIYYKGRLDEREIFNRYKAEVKAAAVAQEEKVRQIEAKNERLFKETQNAYNTKLTALRSYYSMRLAGQSGSELPQIPTTPGGSAGYTADNLPPVATLAAQCAETTLTLTMLQNWVKGVYNNQ